MTTDDFTTAAGIEFKRRFQNMDAYRSDARQLDLFRAFRSGMQYAASQEPTDAEVRAAAHEIHVLRERLDGSNVSSPHTLFDEDLSRAALVAARAVGRDAR